MGEKDKRLEKALGQLIEESYGALAWLQGLVQLSDRARAYKTKKLREALDDAETAIRGDHAEAAVKGDTTMDEQQPGCDRCEALKREANDENRRRIQASYEEFAERLMEIDSEHERGEHAEDTG